MKKPVSPRSGEGKDPSQRRWLLLALGFVLVALVVFLLPRYRETTGDRAGLQKLPDVSPDSGATASERLLRLARGPGTAPTRTAEQIVARKLVQFGKSRRELVHAIAKRLKVDVPDDVERFFDAVEQGRWEAIDAAHEALLLPGSGPNQPRSAELHQIWRALQETWGAAREVNSWPAQKLLDYGETVLRSLRPGMVYVGGTDPGCFIPTFLNETSDGERHITLTQNALADGTYLDYLDLLHGDHLSTLTHDDSDRAFQEYTADARKRLEHDQQFPDEPKQLRPGEDVRLVEGKVEVSGQVAVMAINEKLFQMLMDKNPDAVFAMEQSFPFASLYPNAAPLGPLVELRAQDQQNGLTHDSAEQATDYWRATTQRLLSDPESANSPETMKTYSHDAVAQANLLASHGYNLEAEQAYRLASQLYPSNPESTGSLAAILAKTGHPDQARQILDDFQRKYPDQSQALEKIRASWGIVISQSPGHR